MSSSCSAAPLCLQADRLTVGYQRERVLTLSDFRLRIGEVALIRGENGSGKTTLLRTIAGCLPPVEGRLDWGSPKLANSIAYLPQTRSLFGSLTTGENLELLSADARAARSRIRDLLGRAPDWSRAARSLSGGEVRLVALAGILTGNARVALLDEPFAALAEKLVPEMISWIREEAATKQRSFIVVEHRVLPSADWREFVVRDGVLREQP